MRVYCNEKLPDLSQYLLCVLIALGFGKLQIPDRFGAIGLYTFSIIIAMAQIILCRCMPLICCELIPFHCFSIVLHDSQSFIIANPQIELGTSIPLICC